MVTGKACNTYLNSHYEGMDPQKLILMLYDGALKHLQLVKEGIAENNPQKRGESLSKVIAIVSELNTSLDPTVKDESIDFLRGLYEAILKELPKVSITNDMKTVKLAESYIAKLRDIWANNVMGMKEKDQKTEQMKGIHQKAFPKRTAAQPKPAPTAPAPAPSPKGYPKKTGYPSMKSVMGKTSISA